MKSVRLYILKPNKNKISNEDFQKVYQYYETNGSQRIAGGLGKNNKPSDFDKGELKKGIEVELEHTPDIYAAFEIAMDHLAEHEGYYTALDKMERQLSMEALVNPLFEKKKSLFQKLKDNKVPLEPDERKLVFQRDAVWNYASSKDPQTGKRVKKVSAVWKSVNPKDGETTYITHTHRAFQHAPTLKGAIEKYHHFIKGTA